MVVRKCTAYCPHWHYKLNLKQPMCKNQQKPCAEAALTCELPMWRTNPIRGEYKPLPGIYRAGQQEAAYADKT